MDPESRAFLGEARSRLNGLGRNRPESLRRKSLILRKRMGVLH